MAAKKKINIFNPGRGFVKAYDYSVSGLSVTPGCAFGCLYCYSPTILHKSLDDFKAGKDPKLEYDEWVAALKEQAPKVAGHTVYANVMTDPYQPATRKFTRAMLWAFLSFGLPSKFVLQTRSPLIVQDIDLLKRMKEVLRVNFTIETNDESVRKDFSPSAPGLEARWRAVDKLAEAGIPVCITCTPTLPFSDKRVDWAERVNGISTLTHVVFQEFHNGSLTKTSPEAYGIADRFGDHFKEGGYERLIQELADILRVPVYDGMLGFAPDAPEVSSSD